MDTEINQHTQRWREILSSCTEAVSQCEPLLASGRLTRVTGMVMEA